MTVSRNQIGGVSHPSAPAATACRVRRRARWILVALVLSLGSISAALTEAERQAILEKGREHWAFQPLNRPDPPKVRQTQWLRQPIDRFLLASMEARGISPAPEANLETYIRRVTFDLTGLPPTPAEIDDFLQDNSPDAPAALVERLLASPRYGERWGRHWLDLARYAESDGFEHDAIRPHAWRYRDYVIDAFNADKPYDQFIKEQVAGDEMFPDEREAQVATAFNLLGPDMVDSADQVQRRLNRLNDMTDTTGLVFLGLTVGCARCHDHLFEPISQRDYYRLQAFFTPSEFRDDWPIPTREERENHQRLSAAHEKRVREIEDAVMRLEAPYREQERQSRLETWPEEARAVYSLSEDQRTEAQKAFLEPHLKKLEISDKELEKLLRAEDRAAREDLRRRLKQLPSPPPLPATMALRRGLDNRVKTHVLFRGDYSNPREEVNPGLPEILVGTKDGAVRRGELADWMADPSNPLTARVMVNRIWQHHFGRGLVPTPSDFGLNGLPPTHPELLDWLATEFIRQGWSVKAMHRLILLSAAYRQSARATPEARENDPENRWYSRWRPLRLEGEAIRDSLLFISGRLHHAMGGPSVYPPIPKEVFEGATGWKTSASASAQQRRSVYIFARRNLRFPFLEVFDAPDSNLSCARREESTTAPQSLTLLNADEVMEACEAVATQIESGHGDWDEQVDQAFRRILGCAPAEEERLEARRFLEQSPLSELCRVLFNLNAFIYVH